MNLAKNLAGPFVPGLKDRLDNTGIGGLKAVVFSSGFDGKESRALYEFDVPGERKGLTKVLKGGTPLGLNDLPPMPPDVSRFSALRLDPTATYDAGLSLIDLLTMTSDYGVRGEARSGASRNCSPRKEYLMRETDKFLGVSVADAILPHLGDKLVVFQSPTEGLQVFGSVICISVKDAAKVRTAHGPRAARSRGHRQQPDQGAGRRCSGRGNRVGSTPAGSASSRPPMRSSATGSSSPGTRNWWA